MTDPASNGRAPAPAVVTDDAAERERLRHLGRVALGVTGSADRVRMRDVLAEGAGLRGLLAMIVRGLGTALPLGVLIVAVPELAEDLSIDPSHVIDAAMQLLAVAAFVGIIAASAVHGRSRRMVLIGLPVLTAAGSALLLTAKDEASLGLFALLTGAAAGAAATVTRPLLLDVYAPGGRPRLLASFRASQFGGLLLAALLVQAGGWELAVGATLALSLVSIPLTFFFRDPGVGAPDLQRVRALVSDDVVVEEATATRREALSRLASRPSARSTIVVQAVAGLFTLPVLIYLLFRLEDQFGDDAISRGTVIAVVTGVAVLAVLVDARRIEAAYRSEDERSLSEAAAAQIVSFVMLAAAALFDEQAIVLAAAALAVAAQAMSITRVDTVLLSVLPPQVRGFSAAIATFVFSLVGGVAGLQVLASIDSRFGSAWALGIAALPALTAALALLRTAPELLPDLDRTLDTIIGEQQIRAQRATGRHVPLLRATGINFAYGQVQILFGIDFTVDEGEMVALLGTNGAGKSTLLRVISGLGVPKAGTVRLDGADITYATPSDRVRAGISQVPGGKATFGPMSVIDNLRVYGYSLGTDRKRVDDGIEQTFALFPRLHERRNQLAQTLSGGEQQMLAMGKALILRPRLLLIDELSLGLAPKIVGELLEMVRTINAQGTAVVLVEQSVNVALSLAHHAYYMEKGEMRFDGPSAELLERPDVLRSVYLKGAAEGLGA